MYRIRKFLTAILSRQILVICPALCVISATGLSQPANDDCTNASVVTVSNSGFGLGTFTAATFDLTSATVQTGETFAPAILVAGQIQKSVWYKFSIPTTRAIRVTLVQPGSAITAGDAGFAVYKATSCLPGNINISTKLTPLGVFGNTYHPCVDSGTYYIQVSGKSSANGPVYITVETAFPTTVYDRPAQAYNFGTLSQGVKTIDYTVECQSLEDASEICSGLGNASAYVKSSWHIFKTPSYFDYVGLLLASPTGSFGGNVKIGYKIYQGDVTTSNFNTLPVIVSCDSLITGGNFPARKVLKCNDIQPNTTYSIQLFFYYNFIADIRLALTLVGTAPTQAPEPILSAIPASNSLGVLPSNANGIITNISDQLACNALHSLHPCNPTLPANGVVYAGRRYNLSTFFTFTLSGYSRIDFNINNSNCYNTLLFRIFYQSPSNSCSTLDTLNIVGQGNPNFTLGCLDPGSYTVQILGTDSTMAQNSLSWVSVVNSTTPLCLNYNLGQKVQSSLRVYSVLGINKFSINTAGAFDSINVSGGNMQPLMPGVTYTAKRDTFGCKNTVLPNDVLCSPAITKAQYREFVLADSGFVTFAGWNGYYNWNKIYQGDANALAIAQNVFSYPSVINGLVPKTTCINWNGCIPANVCLTPGTYTHTSFASSTYTNVSEQPTFKLNILETKHKTELLAQDMGSIIDSMQIYNQTVARSDTDYFSCRDNAVPINGYLPCNNGNVWTKAIYRQFYIKNTSIVAINGYTPSCGSMLFAGNMTLFYGKATDGLNTLTPYGAPLNCFANASTPSCNPLQPGWYTIVSYGTGPSYANPMQNLNQFGYGGHVGIANAFSISITPACPGPKFNRPYKAAIDTTTGNPFLIEWGPNGGHTAAYPKTDKTYTLYKENFNCTVDAPFYIPFPACNPSLNKTAYYVFRITQESYVQIDLKNNFYSLVYAGNARTDSSLFNASTLIQPCGTNTNISRGYIQICKMQPGDYTLVVLAASNLNCDNVTPEIYIDKVGYSRFDHAKNAFDFGLIPADSAYHFGKPGDVNPLDPSRAPSDDFFYCTTGAQQSDPTNAVCGAEYNSQIYNNAVNNVIYNGTTNASPNPWNIARRNLWYTFVVDKGGYVKVRAVNRTIGKGYQYPFAVYKSDVNGTLSFITVVSNGLVDSTTNQGLSFIAQNTTNQYCSNRPNEISFYREPCNSTAERYYVVIENTNSYPYELPGMKPNSQVEVGVLLDTVTSIPTKFDHYFQASNIGSALGAGTYTGATDNYMCATRGATDPIFQNYSCGTKTLWYKFTATVTGHVKFRLLVNGQSLYSWTDISLYRQIIPGDSTSNGLQFLNGSNAGIYDNATATTWGIQCINPGTYYLLLSGCSRVNEYEYPQIQILEEAGDFCNAPVMANLNGAGTNVSSVLVDCHTIGTDYGEFNPTLTCPNGAPKANYKTSWFRINITGTDTLDVTTYLTENTNATSSQIKYRLMNGDCGAMQERSCVQDALTQDTYKCLAPGSYWVQVFSPVNTIGTISLNLNAVHHADTCAPINPCLSNANFQKQFDCTVSSAVQFINYSTFGASVSYLWDFGYNGQTSTAVSPSFIYPALTISQKYYVTLSVTNTTCGGVSLYRDSITIPPRPGVFLGNDTSLCNGGTVLLNATSHARLYLFMAKRICRCNLSRQYFRIEYLLCQSNI